MLRFLHTVSSPSSQGLAQKTGSASESAQANPAKTKKPETLSAREMKVLRDKQKGLRLPAVLIGEILFATPGAFHPPQLKAISAQNSQMTHELLSDKRLEYFADISDIHRAQDARVLWHKAHPESERLPTPLLYDLVMKKYEQIQLDSRSKTKVVHDRSILFHQDFYEQTIQVSPKEKREQREWQWAKGAFERMMDPYHTRYLFEAASDANLKVLARYLDHPIHQKMFNFPSLHGISRLLDLAPDRLGFLNAHFISETGMWLPMNPYRREALHNEYVRTSYGRYFERCIAQIVTGEKAFFGDEQMRGALSEARGDIGSLLSTEPVAADVASQPPASTHGSEITLEGRQAREMIAWASFGKQIVAMAATKKWLHAECERLQVSPRDVAAGQAELLHSLRGRELMHREEAAWVKNKVFPFVASEDHKKQIVQAEFVPYLWTTLVRDSVRLERIESIDFAMLEEQFSHIPLEGGFASEALLDKHRLDLQWHESALQNAIPVFLHYSGKRKERLAALAVSR